MHQYNYYQNVIKLCSFLWVEDMCRW